jgi:hypothetical protein
MTVENGHMERRKSRKDTKEGKYGRKLRTEPKE